MMALADETEFFTWAEEQAPQTAAMTAMLNTRDLLGTLIFNSGVKDA
jgi:hypothetical protein